MSDTPLWSQVFGHLFRYEDQIPSIVIGGIGLGLLACFGAIVDDTGRSKGDWAPAAQGAFGILLAYLAWQDLRAGDLEPDQFEWYLMVIAPIGLNAVFGGFGAPSRRDDIAFHVVRVVVWLFVVTVLWDLVVLIERAQVGGALYSDAFLGGVQVIALLETVLLGGAFVSLLVAIWNRIHTRGWPIKLARSGRSSDPSAR